MTKVLVVDDDPSLLKAMRIGLTARGDDVLVAHSGADAINQVALAGPDLVILDLGLPDVDGLEVCRRVREFSNVPIVVLPAYGDERRNGGTRQRRRRLRDEAIRHGRARGAAWAAPARRRRPERRGREVHRIDAVGDLEVDLFHHMATMSGSALQLTAKEFELLAHLARHAGKVRTHHMILKDVWGPGYEPSPTTCGSTPGFQKMGDEEGRLLKTVHYVSTDSSPVIIPARQTSRAGCA